MIDILALLKRIEWGDGDDICPCCDVWRKNDNLEVNEHDQDCQLKAAIDAIESGRLVVVDEQTAKRGNGKYTAI